MRKVKVQKREIDMGFLLVVIAYRVHFQPGGLVLSYIQIHFKDANIFCVFNQTNKRPRGKICVAAQTTTAIKPSTADTYNEYL